MMFLLFNTKPVHGCRYRFSRLCCVRKFGSQSASEVLFRLRRDGLTDGGGRRNFKVLQSVRHN